MTFACMDSGFPNNKAKQDADRFSNLPPEVLQAILSRLTIKDALRTSILSSSWRNTWTAIPHLTFSRSTVPSASCHPDLHHLRCVNIVDRVLLHHQGPIRKFHLIDFLKFCPDVDRWIFFLSKHGIENLILASWVGRPHKLSSHLFSCQRLQYLALRGFVIEPSPTITPLANLKILALSRVSISDVSLKRLLSACQFLEELRLESFHGLCQIEILAQKLKQISLCGSFQDLLLETPLLVSARIDMESLIDHFDEEENGQTGESGVCNLIKVLGGLRCIQKLKIREHFLSFLASGQVPKTLLAKYEHLKHLSLSINFSNVNEISSAFCLITSSPYLQKLHILSIAEETFDPHEFAWEAPGFKLNCLHSMEMGNVMCGKNELDLLEFVLANAPLLGTMTVGIRSDDEIGSGGEAAFLRELNRFRRASTQATITSLHYD